MISAAAPRVGARAALHAGAPAGAAGDELGTALDGRANLTHSGVWRARGADDCDGVIRVFVSDDVRYTQTNSPVMYNNIVLLFHARRNLR